MTNAPMMQSTTTYALDVLCNPYLWDQVKNYQTGRPEIVQRFLRYVYCSQKCQLFHARVCKYCRQNIMEVAISGEVWKVANWFFKQEDNIASTWLTHVTLCFKSQKYPSKAYARLQIVRWLHVTINDQFPCWKEYMSLAIRNGDIEIVKFLFLERNIYSREDLYWAAWYGHLDIVIFLHDHNFNNVSDRAIDAASRHGHLDIIQYLNERGSGCTTNAMDWAASLGHFHVVKYLHENRSEGCTDFAIEGAARNGHLDIVKYLCKHRHDTRVAYAICEARAHGHAAIVHYLKKVSHHKKKLIN